eukprot:gene9843-7729_t
MGGFHSTVAVKPKVVLVPPMLERDVRSRNRFAKPSYDYMFCKKQIEHLLGDFNRTGLRGMLLFSPPEDKSVSVKASLGAIGSTMALRYQPDPELPYSFLDMKTGRGQAGTGPRMDLRGSYFDTVYGLGIFANVPINNYLARDKAKVAQCGRMGSWSAGLKFSTDQTPVVELPALAKFVSVCDVAEWVNQHTSIILAYSPIFNAGSSNASSDSHIFDP